MFGLEKQKKKKVEPFIFDLEKDCKNASKYKELKARIDKRIQQIKEVLRSGESKADYDTYGVLLHGYTSLLKVLARIGAK